MGSSAIPKNTQRRRFWPGDSPATIVQWALIVGAAGLAVIEAFIDGPYGAQERDWLEVLLPYIPLVGLAIRPSIGFVFWLGALFGMAAIGAPPSSIAAAIVPSIIVIGVSTYAFGRRMAVITAVAAGLLSFTIPYLFIENGLNAGALLAGMVAIGSAGGLGLNFYRHRTAAQDSQIHDLRTRQHRVRSEERRRLGSELHDSVAHDVTIIAMQARRARLADDPEQIRNITEVIGTTAQQALQNLRNMVVLLHEDEMGTVPSLKDATGPGVRGETVSQTLLLEEARKVETSLRNTGFEVELTMTGDVEGIPSSLSPALLRSVREIGTNILKYADASKPVSVQFEVTEKSVTLASSNSISPTPPISSSGSGLAAMEARSLTFGGALEVDSQGGVWMTRLTLPFGGSLAD